MKKFISSVAVIVGFLIVSGCSTTQDNTQNINVDEEAYVLHSTYAKNATTQYGLYYFLPYETRNIIVHGWFPESEKETFTSIYCSGSGVSSQTSQIGNGPNMYKNIAGSGYEFVVPVEITAPLIWGEYDVNVIGPGVSSTFTLKVGENRNYTPIYNCMISYNLFDQGFEFTNRLNAAFNEANTYLSFDMQNTNLPDENLDYLLVPQQWVDYLYAYWHAKGVIPTHPPKDTEYLIGCKNLDPADNPPQIRGLSIWRSTEPNKHKISMVFVEGILGTYPSQNLNKKYVTYVTIHELGHGRGQNFTQAQGYYDNDITDENHTGGHNGTNTNYCVMRMRGNQNDPEFTEERFLQALDNPRFCYGHLQMLLNADW